MFQHVCAPENEPKAIIAEKGVVKKFPPFFFLKNKSKNDYLSLGMWFVRRL